MWQMGTAILFILMNASTGLSSESANSPCLPSSPESALESLGGALQSVADQTEPPLVRASRELSRKIDQDAPTRIPDATIESLRKRIQETMKSSEYFNAGTENERIVSNNLYLRLVSILDSLKAQGKLRYLDKNARAKLGVDHYLCAKAGKCKEMLGLYIPLSNHILIDPSLSPEESGKALFHELMHAEQFIYRFPLDLEKLNQFAKDNRLRKEQINSFLSAYYEYQANYQGMRYLPAQEWKKEFQSFGGKGLWSGLTNTFTLGAANERRLSLMNSYLPDVDHVDGGGVAGTELAALLPSELVPVRNYSLGNGWYDLDFHYRFAKALNRTYFDDQVPTEKFAADDSKMQLELHNNYYKNVGGVPIEREPGCASLIQEIANSKDAPLVQWLTMPEEKIKSCPAYAQAPSQTARDQYANEILNSTAQGTPFVFAGGEGDRPGLRVYPVQPDLKVLPNE